jgi:hypothetical protein
MQPAELVIVATQVHLGRVPLSERGQPARGVLALLNDRREDERREGTGLDLRIAQPRDHSVAQGVALVRVQPRNPAGQQGIGLLIAQHGIRGAQRHAELSHSGRPRRPVW